VKIAHFFKDIVISPDSY